MKYWSIARYRLSIITDIISWWNYDGRILAPVVHVEMNRQLDIVSRVCASVNLSQLDINFGVVYS